MFHRYWTDTPDEWGGRATLVAAAAPWLSGLPVPKLAFSRHRCANFANGVSGFYVGHDSSSGMSGGCQAIVDSHRRSGDWLRGCPSAADLSKCLLAFVGSKAHRGEVGTPVRPTLSAPVSASLAKAVPWLDCSASSRKGLPLDLHVENGIMRHGGRTAVSVGRSHGAGTDLESGDSHLVLS